MVKVHVITTTHDTKSYIYIPAFVKHQFNLTKQSDVDLIIDRDNIIITIKNPGKKE